MITPSIAVSLPDWAGTPFFEETKGGPVITHFDPPDLDVKTGLTDLSTRPKAVVNGPAAVKEINLEIGEAQWNGEAFSGMATPDEGWIFDLCGPHSTSWKNPAYTDLTHALALFALWGETALEVLRRFVAVDVERPSVKKPFFISTRCHAFLLNIINCKTPTPVFLLSCTRSHGQNLFDLILSGGRHLGLRLAGIRKLSQIWEIRIGI
jgi:hypothetical protein